MSELNIGMDKDGSVVIGKLVTDEHIFPIMVFPNVERAREFAEGMLDFLLEKQYPVPVVYLEAFEEDLDEYDYDFEGD